VATPLLVFTAFKSSFKVHVNNLELLSVEQIQEIESFVKSRKGIFDFNTYTFVIQKKLEYKEFVKLVKESPLDAFCKDDPVIVQVKARIGFGQYKGMQYSELPDSYLVWLKGSYSGADREIIKSEISSRKL